MMQSSQKQKQICQCCSCENLSLTVESFIFVFKQNQENCRLWQWGGKNGQEKETKDKETRTRQQRWRQWEVLHRCICDLINILLRFLSLLSSHLPHSRVTCCYLDTLLGTSRMAFPVQINWLMHIFCSFVQLFQILHSQCRQRNRNQNLHLHLHLQVHHRKSLNLFHIHM